MSRFNRTGYPPEDIYDLAEGAYIVDIGEPSPYRRIVTRELERECETDPRTLTISVTKFDNGKVLLWGEDVDNQRTWLREDDEIARQAYELHADLFDLVAYPPKAKT